MDAKHAAVEQAPALARETGLLGAGEWVVVWRHEPKRIGIQHIMLPKPEWADEEWVPEGADSWLMQDVACRAVLKTFTAAGYDPWAVDDCMGEAIEAWAANPQRAMYKPGSEAGEEAAKRPWNELMRCYEAMRAHITGGGRFRDLPVELCEVVGANFGFETWLAWLHREKEKYGPFEGVHADLVQDLWSENAVQLPRVQ